MAERPLRTGLLHSLRFEPNIHIGLVIPNHPAAYLGWCCLFPLHTSHLPLKHVGLDKQEELNGEEKKVNKTLTPSFSSRSVSASSWRKSLIKRHSTFSRSHPSQSCSHLFIHSSHLACNSRVTVITRSSRTVESARMVRISLKSGLALVSRRQRRNVCRILNEVVANEEGAAYPQRLFGLIVQGLELNTHRFSDWG